jgi:5-methylcytosine-specific restriction endonuclease McrA
MSAEGPVPIGFIRTVSDAELRREKDRARRLRATGWWRTRLARGRCDYCERPTPPRELTMDHRLPLVRGGRSTRGNVAAVCKACNTAKRYLLPTEWQSRLEELRRAPEGRGRDG